MRRLVALSLFLGTAMASFVLTTPGEVTAGTRTAPGRTCIDRVNSTQNVIGYVCGFQIGSDFPTASLNGAYIDFRSAGTGSVIGNIYKKSDTGTSYRDYKSFPVSSGVSYNLWVDAVNVKTLASIWDTVYADLGCGGGVVGCAVSVYGMSLANPL